MTKAISIHTSKEQRTIPVVWVGEHLAVHHPIAGGGLSKEPCWWAITHAATGYLAGPALEAPQRTVIALAKLWDAAFSTITAAGNAHGWQWGSRWADDLSRVQRGRPVIGPRELTPLEELDSAGTYKEVETAVRRAMGYSPVEEPEASEQFPAEVTAKKTGKGAIRRNPTDGELELWWLPTGGNYSDAEAISLAGWYPVPATADVEDWCLGSVAETPDGQTVEPDHPDAWPRLLGLI